MSAEPKRLETPEIRIAELDALRGLAVLAVLAFHYTTRFDAIYGYAEPLPVAFPHGHFGVEFFFVISGFVITWTTARTRAVRDFAVSRFSRLWPAYAVGVAFTFALVAAFGLPGREVTPLQALINFTMVQELFGLPHVDGAYWSLYVELIFYGWTAVALALGWLDRRKTIVLAGLACVFAVQLLQDLTGWWIPGRALKLMLADHFPLFAIGIVIFDARRAGGGDWRHAALVFAAVVLAGYTAKYGTAIVAALAAVSVYGAASGWFGFLAVRPLLFLGSISYSLYLLHQNLGYVVIRAVLDQGWGAPAAIALASAVSIGCAVALRRFVEVPGQRAIRRVYAARTAARAAVAV